MIVHNRLGIFPGSFDPFHKGHLDILEQALLFFDVNLEELKMWQLFH
jgi:phosphopantetheine adenylyltransferase